MASPQEKQELIDHLKDPRFYSVTLWGYGGESAYINLNKAQYDYWKAEMDENGEENIMEYMLEAEEKEKSEWTNIPDEAHFMYDEEGDARPWYEHHDEFEHQYGVSYDHGNLSIDEVKNAEWSSGVIKSVVDAKDISEWIETLNEGREDYLDIVEMGCVDNYGDKYVLQFYSSEKGTFFDGMIETHGEFDPAKLKIFTTEYPNGEDIVTELHYDGVEIDNNGGDGNGKGYSIHLWENS